MSIYVRANNRNQFLFHKSYRAEPIFSCLQKYIYRYTTWLGSFLQHAKQTFFDVVFTYIWIASIGRYKSSQHPSYTICMYRTHHNSSSYIYSSTTYFLYSCLLVHIRKKKKKIHLIDLIKNVMHSHKYIIRYCTINNTYTIYNILLHICFHLALIFFSF